MVELDTKLDFSKFINVNIIGIDTNSLSNEEKEVLYTQSKYCQAMVDADIDVLKDLVLPDVIFTHMSGMKQTRDEYFQDIKNGRLNYYNIGIENPKIKVTDNIATIEYTLVLYASAYGATSVYRMSGTHRFKKVDNKWYYAN